MVYAPGLGPGGSNPVEVRALSPAPGPVAQLVERGIRIAEVRSSTLLGSTNLTQELTYITVEVLPQILKLYGVSKRGSKKKMAKCV